MQLTLSNTTLKAPGTKRLKLDFDELLSTFAFNFNLRRFIEAEVDVFYDDGNVQLELHGKAVQIEPMIIILKAPETKRFKLKCDKPVSTVAFKSNLRRYSTASS